MTFFSPLEVYNLIYRNSIIMKSGDDEIESPQQEDDFLRDQKHQEYMQAALDMVQRV